MTRSHKKGLIDYLDIIAAIHFCSSVLFVEVSIGNDKKKGNKISPVKMKQHPQYRDQLLLVLFILLLQKL